METYYKGADTLLIDPFTISYNDILIKTENSMLKIFTKLYINISSKINKTINLDFLFFKNTTKKSHNVCYFGTRFVRCFQLKKEQIGIHIMRLETMLTSNSAFTHTKMIRTNPGLYEIMKLFPSIISSGYQSIIFWKLLGII